MFISRVLKLKKLHSLLQNFNRCTHDSQSDLKEPISFFKSRKGPYINHVELLGTVSFIQVSYLFAANVFCWHIVDDNKGINN